MSAGLEKIKEAFLPFWLARARCSVQLNGARLGFDVWVNRYNPARRRSEPMLETSWQWVRLERAAWEQNYTADDAGMQVHCSDLQLALRKRARIMMEDQSPAL